MSIKIMSQIWENSNQSGAGLLLLLALADHANDEGYCYPGVNRLAHKIRRTENAVQKTLKALVESGDLEIYHNQGIQTASGKTNLYRIIIPQGVEKVIPQKKGVEIPIPQGVEKTTPDGVEKVIPKPSVYSSCEPSGNNGNGKNPLYGDTDEYDSLPDIVKQSLRTNDTDWQYLVKRFKAVKMNLSINPAKEDDMWRLYKSLTPPAGETVKQWVDYVAGRVADKPITPGWKFVETIFTAIQTSGSLAKNIAEFEGKYKNGGVKEQSGPVQTTASKLSPEQLEMIKQFSNGGEKRNYVHG